MTKIWTSFTSLFTYLDYLRKIKRVKSDCVKAIEEWYRIGGFEADTGLLLNYVNDYAQVLIEYATWTPTEIDDWIFGLLHEVLITHQDMIIMFIDQIRAHKTMSASDMINMTESVSMMSGEYGNAMTVLMLLTNLYQVLIWLRNNKFPIPDTIPPQPDTTPPERKRPIITFIRKICGKP